jgi:hypothetical protein
VPATWGYGAAGTEPVTMAGWGFLSDLAGTISTVIPVMFRNKGPQHLFQSKGAQHKFHGKDERYRFYKHRG